VLVAEGLGVDAGTAFVANIGVLGHRRVVQDHGILPDSITEIPHF
jgi:hypothetical protein